MNVITKVYYLEHSNELDDKIAIINKPAWCLGLSYEPIEMGYMELRVECLESQVQAIESAIADFV